MKKIFFLLAAVLSFTACRQSAKGTNGVTYKSPVQYNDYIVGRQTTLMKNIVDFSKASQVDLDSAEQMLDGYVIETSTMINDIKGMPPYKGDSSLRDAAVRTFRFYKKVFEDDYKQIIRLNKEGESLTDEGAAKVNSIVENISKEEEKLDKAFHNAQSEFASKNNMKLMENSMQKKVNELNKD
jgi:hypothetical protein